MIAVLASGTPVVYSVLFGTGTIIAGVIGSDTTWTKANSPYLLSGPTAVKNGVRLTIESGVVVNLNGSSLQIDGVMIARGSDNEKVYFNDGSVVFSSKETIESESAIENAVLSDSVEINVISGAPSIYNNEISGGFVVNGGSPSITGNTIDSRLFVKGGSPVISNNKISDGVHADARGGPVTIANNDITSKSGFTVVYVQGVHADILGNKIVGNNNMGIYVWLRISSASITNNQVSNCSTGIRAEAGAQASDQVIAGNVVFDNSLGIVSWSYVDIHGNTVAQNSIGIYSNGPIIKNNNIQNNSEYNFESQWQPYAVDATNNWWGTTDIQSINQTIFDAKNDPAWAQVIFMPVLNAPNSDAPSIPNVSPMISLLSIKNKTYTTSDIPLDFAVNEQCSQMSYSLDGKENVSIVGNTTLTGLANGDHYLTIYAEDEAGNIGTSETMYFSVDAPEPFPTTLAIAASVASIAAVTAGAVVYWKKRKHQPPSSLQ